MSIVGYCLGGFGRLVAAGWLPDPPGENGPDDLCSFNFAGNGLDDTGLSISSGECSLDVLSVVEEGSMGVSSSSPVESLGLFSSSSMAGDKREKVGRCCSTTLSSSGLEKYLALWACSGEKGSSTPMGVSNAYILRDGPGGCRQSGGEFLFLLIKCLVLSGEREGVSTSLSSLSAILQELIAGAFVHVDVVRPLGQYDTVGLKDSSRW